MTIEYDLLDFFVQHGGAGKRDRNIEMFLYRFGFFQKALWPTLEETGDEYLEGNKDADEKNRRERPRQLIADNLKVIKRKGIPIPSLKALIELFSSIQFVRSSDLAIRFYESGITSNPVQCNIRGLLNLVQALGFCIQLDIFNPNLNRAGRANYSLDQEYFVMDRSIVDDLREGCKLAERLSGDLGLVSFSYLCQNLGELCKYQVYILEIIQLAEDTICVTDGRGETYFHFFNKKDGFVSCLGRVFSVADRVHINELVEAMRRPIVRRQGGKVRQLLPPDAIKNFIRVYSFLQVEDDWVTFLGQRQPVRDIEADIFALFQEKNPRLFIDLYRTLGKMGYGTDNIKDTIYHSPIIGVDTSRGFGNYLYFLIGSGFAVPVPEDVLDEGEEWRKVSVDEFNKMQEDAKNTGNQGEEFVNAYLDEAVKQHNFILYEWVSKKFPVAPYDFKAGDQDGNEILIDVKATTWGFEATMHISYMELCKMSESRQYYIYRIFQMNGKEAKLRISDNLIGFGLELLAFIERMPYEARPDTVSIDPAKFAFGDEISIVIR
jgi:hypothetical protein